MMRNPYWQYQSASVLYWEVGGKDGATHPPVRRQSSASHGPAPQSQRVLFPCTQIPTVRYAIDPLGCRCNSSGVNSQQY